MGVDCKIILPGNVEVGNVALVLGAAAGLPKTMNENKPYNFSYAKVNGVEVKCTSHFPSMAEIHLTGKLIDGWDKHFVLYHFEYRGLRLLSPRSTAFWIACGKKLVDFFGGRMDYQDCDSKCKDYFAPRKSRKLNCPQDGKAWDDFQQRIMAVEPVTQAELEECIQYAAYGHAKSGE